MKREELDRVLADHALYWKTDKQEGAIAFLEYADLSGDNLAGADLRRASLREANLCGANLSGANLREADMSGAFLKYADLRGTNLRDTCLCEANLEDADLSGADLRYANLSRASLSGAQIDLNIEDGLLRKVALKVLAGRGSFDNKAWHSSCNTVHCIAGYGCYMASNRKIESEYGTEVAGLMLLGIEAHGHFFDDRKSALEWLKEVVERPITSA